MYNFGKTLIATASKFYNAPLLNPIRRNAEKILRKNQNDFRRNRSANSQILTIRRIIERVRVNNFEATLLFVDFSNALDSIHRGNREQMLLAYGLHKETVTAIRTLYKNMKTMVR